MKKSCIAIQLDHNKPVIIALDKLGYLHIVGVAGGHVRLMAGTPEVDGAFTSYRWPEVPINNSSQVSVYLDDCSEITAPSFSENQTIRELEERMRKTSEKLKEFEERASHKMESSNSQVASRPRVYTVQVFRESQPVFDVSGEHVQFEINWKPDREPKISVWALESYEQETPKDHFVCELNGPEKFILRFGS